LMINWEIEVEWVCWFDLRYVWFDCDWDPNMWDLRDNNNSDGMNESLLSINERFLNFVIIHTSDGIISMLRLFNTNTSSLIQFFILNGNLLICVVSLNLNSLKFVKCSNSVGILLRELQQSKLRVCNWVSE
jgi:hypothetical protein